MTDDGKNLTPAKPVAPRRKLPANPRMAQPVSAPRRKPEPAVAPAPAHQMELDEEAIAGEAGAEPETAAEVQEQTHEHAFEATAEAEVAAVMAEAPTPIAEVFTPVQPVVEARAQPLTQPAPAQRATQPASTEQREFDFPKTMRETLQLVDSAWAAFRAAAGHFPSERIDERLGDGWTVKQMLEHVAAWHDLTADRVVKMIHTGTSVPLDRDTDSFNAAVARQAIGKTSGEVLKDMDATFNRLRRQLARVTDAQLANDDWWLALVIGGNTYGHYDEHWTDIYTADAAPNTRARR